MDNGLLVTEKQGVPVGCREGAITATDKHNKSTNNSTAEIKSVGVSKIKTWL